LNGGAPTRLASVRLELAPSGRFAGVIVAVHGVAAGCFLTVLTGWPGVTAALLLVALGCAAAWDRALLRAKSSPRAIEIPAQGKALCRLADGGLAELAPLGGSAVTRYWVALRMQAPARRSLFVTAGMLTPESQRLLRLWALWGRLPAVAPRQLSVDRK